ncbi:MAG: acyclic terpene utilization AtuA family protein [Clostridia bacterium]|nr:acyclic terpene utilization AtuA family protein [Clostridia bacterium]
MKLLSLSGILGYGFSEEALKNAFIEPPDYVGVDGGSVDPGPYYLGKGVSFTTRDCVKRDVSLSLEPSLKAHAPYIVGTAGGSGSSSHLEWLRDIFFEVAREQGLSFKMALIYTDVDKPYVLQKLQNGKVISLGDLPLTEKAIADSCRIVSQIGVSPIIEALKAGADVVLAGRSCDTAIFAAPCIMHGYDPALAFHMAKIMECGSMCAEPISAADVMQGVIEKDYFELTPAHPKRRCTVRNVAAHTMYEQSNPYMIYEPDGVINLLNARYEQVNERTVRVSGSRFIPTDKPTLKLEGVRPLGFRSVAFAGIKDPETVKRIDEIFDGVCAFVRENTKGLLNGDDYTLSLHKYGVPLSKDAEAAEPAHDLGLIIDVVAKTEHSSEFVLSLARSRMLHYDYKGRKGTAGNLAFPFSPSDIHLGEVFEYSIYHLAEVDSLLETSEIRYINVGGSDDTLG